jgi:hypothetical protein
MSANQYSGDCLCTSAWSHSNGDPGRRTSNQQSKPHETWGLEERSPLSKVWGLGRPGTGHSDAQQGINTLSQPLNESSELHCLVLSDFETILGSPDRVAPPVHCVNQGRPGGGCGSVRPQSTELRSRFSCNLPQCLQPRQSKNSLRCSSLGDCRFTWVSLGGWQIHTDEWIAESPISRIAELLPWNFGAEAEAISS